MKEKKEIYKCILTTVRFHECYALICMLAAIQLHFITLLHNTTETQKKGILKTTSLLPEVSKRKLEVFG